MIKVIKKKIKKNKNILFYFFLFNIIMACIFYSLNENINLFLTPSDLINKNYTVNKNIRLGGIVKKGSIKKGSGLYLSFITTDFSNEIEVKYNGILPDLFREGQGIVAHGKYLDNGIFYAKEILTKHDEKYMPPVLKKNK